VTEAQWGTIAPHLPRGSLQAGGARVSNRDVVEGSSGLDDRRAVARISATDVPLDRPVDGAWTETRMRPACACGASFSTMLDARGRLQSENTVHGWLDCLGKEGPPMSVMTTRGKTLKGLMVVDGDGIMFGARWYTLTPCGYMVTVCGVV
jgi:hypothetical protein